MATGLRRVRSVLYGVRMDEGMQRWDAGMRFESILVHFISYPQRMVVHEFALGERRQRFSYTYYAYTY